MGLAGFQPRLLRNPLFDGHANDERENMPTGKGLKPS